MFYHAYNGSVRVGNSQMDYISFRIVGTTSASEIADNIRVSKLFIYNGLGHAAYEEAKDFNVQVLNFLIR